MAKNKKNKKDKINEENKEFDERIVKELNSEGNLNENHSGEAMSIRRTDLCSHKNADQRSSYKTRSKATDMSQGHSSANRVNGSEDLNKSQLSTVQFDEDGETIEMQIDDGGAAAAEFASDEEMHTEVSDSDPEMSDEHEAGEITEGESDEEQNLVPIKKKKDGNRKSVEERLDNLSSMVMAMKDFLMQSKAGDVSPGPSKGTSEKKSKKVKGEINSDGTESEVTIYRNALNQDLCDELDNAKKREVCVDSEITFNVKAAKTFDGHREVKGHDSSSSEE